MPLLNLAFFTAEPMLADTFMVQRRAESIGPNGRSIIAIIQTFNNVAGVVVPASANDLARLPDYDLQRKTITIVSHFAFQGDTAAAGGKADLIVWNGDTYQVVDIQSYQRYGAGFTQVLAGIVAVQPTVP